MNARGLEVMTANGTTIKLEGEYEEHTSGGETITRKIKMQDKVLSPKFPSITNTKAWHNKQGRNLVLASGRADGLEAIWWNEILREGAKFEDFADSGGARYAILDLMLHASLTTIINDGNKTLAAKLASLEDEAMHKQKLLKGRQLGWLIHNWFRLNQHMKPLYVIQDITDLQWMGDD